MDEQLHMQTERKIRDYVTELCQEQNLDPALNLFEHGYLSSLDILDLISFIEETFDISIPDDDLNIENFGSIGGMVRLIEKTQQEG
jgi:methoxymalonate biosynthesis acyl carrier protein